MPRRFVALACACATWPAIAARPLTTEDASILEEGRCQLEAWIDRSREATQGWAVPACNFALNVEWQVGFSESRSGGTSRFSDGYAQAKGAWRLTPGRPWSVGWVAGVTRHPHERDSGWVNPYALGVLTGDFGATLVHANVGTSHERATHRDVTLWGLAAESTVHERVTLLGEAFGANRERPFVRAGLRYAAIRDRLDLDVSVVARPGGSKADQLLSIGFLYQTAKR